MQTDWKLLIVFAHFVIGFEKSSFNVQHGTNVNLGEALQFLREYDSEASRMCFRVSAAQWTYSTNMTDFNKRRMIDEQTLKAKFDKVTWKRAAAFDWARLPDQIVRRQLKYLIGNSRASLSDDKYNEIYHLISEMKDIYSHVRVCPFNSPEHIYCDLELDDIVRLMSHSRNPIELAEIWRAFHDRIGPPMKNKFMRYVQIANQASHFNGYEDCGDEMRAQYEDPDFDYEIRESWKLLQPLYKELFTYVRRKLWQRYGPAIIREEGPMPAHVFGNLWAQDWSNIYDLVAPYPEFKQFDVTNEMLRQGFTPLRMFQMAEEFYTSLGLKPMPPEFWRYSMLDKPNDRKVQCTTSAWDFCNKIDYRIKQCTEVDMENLVSTHHEMAHIEYYLYYADQPYLYRNGANPGFHEGVASAVTLSVFNPTHFHRVGLFNDNADTYETSINFLMLMALKKLAFAPFALLVDEWRYKIFHEGVHRMNSDWWELRLKYQGIIPPVPRSEAHFDPGAKRHIPADVPYLRYYVALLLEFQIHYALCYAAGYGGTLHTCDIYRSREAGRMLADLLKVGRARHWKDVMKMIARGQGNRLSAEPMVQYFQPLILWLRVQNKNESVIGWTTNWQEEALFQPYLYGNGAQNSAVFPMFTLVFIIFTLIT